METELSCTQTSPVNSINKLSNSNDIVNTKHSDTDSDLDEDGVHGNRMKPLSSIDANIVVCRRLSTAQHPARVKAPRFHETLAQHKSPTVSICKSKPIVNDHCRSDDKENVSPAFAGKLGNVHREYKSSKRKILSEDSKLKRNKSLFSACGQVAEKNPGLAFSSSVATRFKCRDVQTSPIRNGILSFGVRNSKNPPKEELLHSNDKPPTYPKSKLNLSSGHAPAVSNISPISNGKSVLSSVNKTIQANVNKMFSSNLSMQCTAECKAVLVGDDHSLTEESNTICSLSRNGLHSTEQRIPDTVALFPSQHRKGSFTRLSQKLSSSCVLGELNPGIIKGIRDKKQVRAKLGALIGAGLTKAKEDFALSNGPSSDMTGYDKEIKTNASFTLPNCCHVSEAPRYSNCPEDCVLGHAFNVTSQFAEKSAAAFAAENIASCWLELLHLDIKGRLSALKRSRRRVRSVIISGEMDEHLSVATDLSKPITLDFLRTDETSMWRSFFLQMDQALCTEGDKLETWLRQIMEMQAHNQKLSSQCPLPRKSQFEG